MNNYDGSYDGTYGGSYALTPFRRLLDQIIPQARPYFRAIFPAIGIPLALAAGALTVTRNLWVMDLPVGGAGLDSAVFTSLAILLLTALLFVIVSLLAGTALTVASMDALTGRAVDMGRAWSFAIRGRVLWTSLLVLLVTMISFMMCFLPALVVWPMVSLTFPVMVQEQKFGFEAIRRSAQITWWNGTGRMADSNFLQVSVLLFAGWLIQSAVSGVVQAPMAILQQFLLLREATGGGLAEEMSAWMLPLWIEVPTQVLATLVTAAAWFFWTFGAGKLYLEFERRRHAGDLRQAIAELTVVDLVPVPADEPEVL